MINRRGSNDMGFSAVEVLVSLFIAVAFLLVGYQLYAAVATSSVEARQRAKASSIAYDQMRRIADTTPSTCSSTPSSQTISPSSVDISGLSNVSITAWTSAPHGCPYVGNVLRVKVTVSYRSISSQKEVSHVIYASK